MGIRYPLRAITRIFRLRSRDYQNISDEPLKGFQLWLVENKLELSQKEGTNDETTIQNVGLQVYKYINTLNANNTGG